MIQSINRRLAAALVCLAAVAAAGDQEESKSRSELETGTRVGQRLPHFEAEVWDVTKEQPKQSAFDSHKAGTNVAYIFMSKTCPYCVMYEERLAKMEQDYAKKGIRFVMVYPTRRTPAEQKVAYHKASKFGASMINDKDASIAKTLDIKKTPEIVLVSKRGEIVFRGGIDDSPRDAKKVKKAPLKNACDDLAAGKQVRVTSAPLYG
jgi:thiol-disulfide isomerase/thioredoxin